MKTKKINIKVFLSIIKGLNYIKKTDSFTFEDTEYELVTIREVSTSTTYFFMDCNDVFNIKKVIARSGIPIYDGFNDVKVESNQRVTAYQHEYYRSITKPKRRKQALKNKKEKEKLKEQEKLKKERLKKQKRREQKKKMIRFCMQCGKEFIPERSNQLYCTVECRKKNALKKAGYVQRKNAEIKKKCPVCKKYFIGTQKQIYCSAKCRYTSYYKKKASQNNE